MKFDELVRKVEDLPSVGPSGVGFLLDIARKGRPSSAFITLIPHRDGSWSATRGDLREKVETLRGSDGTPVRFPDESSACRWAWEKIRSTRSNLAERAEDHSTALDDAQKIYERVRELDRSQGIESPF